MDVKIGIADVPREITVQVDETPDDIAARLQDAIANNGIFELTEERGRRILVPVNRIGYVDLGAAQTRPVGFGAV